VRWGDGTLSNNRETGNNSSAMLKFANKNITRKYKQKCAIGW
jgi:hypothetical protein